MTADELMDELLSVPGDATVIIPPYTEMVEASGIQYDEEYNTVEIS